MPTILPSVTPGERIPVLDIVRGVALQGILIMNMPGFGASFFEGADGSYRFDDPVNRGVGLVVDMLFSGKFNSMFSMLFGIGFTIQLGRLMARQPGQAMGIYTRRLVVLLLLGLVHAMVFWGGDVLHMYALLGLGLLAVRRAPDRVIWALIAACLLYPLVSGSLRVLWVTPEAMALKLAELKTWEAADNRIFGHGSFAEAAVLHAREFIYFHSDRLNLWSALGGYVQFATTMLLGLLVGRHGLVQRVAELMPQIRRLQWVSLLVGLVCAAIFGYGIEHTKPMEISTWKILISLSYALSRLGLMFFYVLSIVRLVQHPAWRRRFQPIATAGRAPLTNYLMQTLLCTAIFYGWGLGAWGSLGPAWQLLLSLAIFCGIQVPLSGWWFRSHAYGPLEYAWRVLTYGRRPVSGAAPRAGTA